MKSVKRNFAYNLLLTFCNYLVPFITYPYVSRVLGVTNIGICNYVDSIINYFVLFSTLGIVSYGIREIAKCKDDIEKRSDVFSNLLLVNILLTSVSILVLVTLTYTVDAFYPYRQFLLVGVLKILFNALLIEWFYQGIQEFRFITIRSVSIRLIYVAAVFVFIRERNDAIIYYILTAATTIVNAVVNICYSRKFVHFRLRSIHILGYLIPILVYGYYKILTSLYTTFNTFFLGLTSGDTEVGCFATATKLNTLILSVFTAFTTVMIPKVAQMIKDNRGMELNELANKIIPAVLALSMPIISLCFFYAPEIIRIISGSGFEGAIIPFKIVIFLITIIGLEQIFVTQFLMASENTKPIMVLSTVGAIVGICANVILTPKYHAVGSSISWALSEVAVLITSAYYCRKFFSIHINLSYYIRSLFVFLIYSVPNIIIKQLMVNNYFSLIVSSVLIGCLFIIINYKIYKNPLIIENSEQLYMKIKHGYESKK